MKCSYRGRSKATVWPWSVSPQSRRWARRWGALFLIGCLVVGLGCASRWNGSIGAVLAKNDHDGRLFVREAPADMGAAKAGIQPGDELIAIDGKPVLGMSPADIHNALAGAVGTAVRLSALRDGHSVTFEVQRGPLRGE